MAEKGRLLGYIHGVERGGEFWGEADVRQGGKRSNFPAICLGLCTSYLSPAGTLPAPALAPLLVSPEAVGRGEQPGSSEALGAACISWLPP